jgi:hypothetical protein
LNLTSPLLAELLFADPSRIRSTRTS